MAERIFGIDLGSAFTKVALRELPSLPSKLLVSGDAAGETIFVIPTLVALDTKHEVPRWITGSEANTSEGIEGIVLYRNWKAQVFATAKLPDKMPVILDARPTPQGLPSLLASEEFASLANRYRVTAGDVLTLNQLVRAALNLHRDEPASQIDLANSIKQTEQTEHIAAHCDEQRLTISQLRSLLHAFFRYLRTSALETCLRDYPQIPQPELISAVLCVPAFAPLDELRLLPGVNLLIDAMRQTGWTHIEGCEILSEPYSNTIGVLTRGENHTWNQVAQLGLMFRNGPIIRVTNGDSSEQHYGLLVVDVGAYTTDFALYMMDTQGQRILDFESVSTFELESCPLGIYNLDQEVATLIPDEQADFILRTGSGVDISAFHKAVYSDATPFLTLFFDIGTPNTVMRQIHNTVNDFANRIFDEMAAFLDRHKPTKLQELILTGGGNNIPIIRNRLMQLQYSNRPIPLVHGSMPEDHPLNYHHYHLSDELQRGASALGASSIYFDRAYHSSK